VLKPCCDSFEHLLESSTSPYVDPTYANDQLFLVELMAARAPESCDHLDCPFRGASCWPSVPVPTYIDHGVAGVENSL
jgi:hypothetical protein